ncbi:MAG: DUF805 domain-containing protein [Defluviitaleaceae bacterium]|nr:DUF805 domain-containing protein [Defluviitaleaceae bacterium]
MQEFVSFWKNYINFSDRTTVRGYWIAFLFTFIITAVLGLLTLVLITQLMFLYYIWTLAIAVPSIAMAIRRLRDAGKEWPWIFVIFIPCVGWILYIITMCKPSIPNDGTPVV